MYWRVTKIHDGSRTQGFSEYRARVYHTGIGSVSFSSRPMSEPFMRCAFGQAVDMVEFDG